MSSSVVTCHSIPLTVTPSGVRPWSVNRRRSAGDKDPEFSSVANSSSNSPDSSKSNPAVPNRYVLPSMTKAASTWLSPPQSDAIERG